MRDVEAPPACSCVKCKAGCQTAPGYLVPQDIEPLAGFLGISAEELARDHLDASSGAAVTRPDGSRLWIPTLVPRTREDGSCHWYDAETGRCGVHEVSPFGCAAFNICDDPQSQAESLRIQKRRTWGLMQLGSAIYQQLLAIARPAPLTSIERGAKLKLALKRIERKREKKRRRR